MEMVKGTNLFAKTTSRKKNYQERYEAVKELLPEIELDEKEFYGALILV